MTTQLTHRQTADLPSNNNSGETNTNQAQQDLRSCSTTTTTTKKSSQSPRATAWQFLSYVFLFLLVCVPSFRGGQSLSLLLSAMIGNSASVVLVETTSVVPAVPSLSSSSSRYRTACRIAKTLTTNTSPILSQSYGVGLKFDATQHATALLCHRFRQQRIRQHQQQVAAPQQQQPSLPTPTPTHNNHTVVLTFKSARTGSTYFTDVIHKAIQSTTYQNATSIWEPFSSKSCYHKHSRAIEEGYFKNMTRSFCQSWPKSNITSTFQCELYPNKKSHKKCCPAHQCRPFHATDKEVSVVSLNPRFSDRVRWGALLADLPSTVDVKIFNVRRTNLVKLAYSQYHHGNPQVPPLKDNCNVQEFTVACLLACVTHFGLGDQEFASSVAYGAAFGLASTSTSTSLGPEPAAGHPHLVVYEDVLHDKKLASERLFHMLGMTAAAANTFVFDETEVQQQHGEDLCGYQDIDCPALEKSLREGGYRCLLKQLRSDNTVTWTVPQRKGDRGIDIQGDCEVLPPLTSRHPDRHLLELYVS